jgi:hypothetical protein
VVEALESRLTVFDLRLNHAIQHIAGAAENAVECIMRAIRALICFAPGNLGRRREATLIHPEATLIHPVTH